MSSEKATKRLQKKELEMLADLSDILNRNNIPFYLACGTTLGCVRHKGFIPWDDDVDIYIMGKDYPRLKEVFATQDTGNLAFHDYTTVEGYPYTFPKIVAKETVLVEHDLRHLNYSCGVYIDVFPLIETSDNALLRKILECQRYFYYGLLRAYYFDFHSGVRSVLHKCVTAFAKPNCIQESLYRIYTRGCGGKRYLIDAGVFGKVALLKREHFLETRQLPFENVSMPVPGNYDGYLRDYYGDYMKLPDEVHRVSNHSFEVLIINDEGDLV